MKTSTAYKIIIVQSILAIGGSLYYSNFGDPVYEYLTGEWFDSSNALAPCVLCIWARIMMYPLLPLAITGLVRKSKEFLYYMVPVSFVGILLELYHYGMQKINFPNPFGCTAANPCAALQVNYFGFITIPFLCLVAFLVIFSVSFAAWKESRK